MKILFSCSTCGWKWSADYVTDWVKNDATRARLIGERAKHKARCKSRIAIDIVEHLPR